ncbi:hypothetical protein ASD97_40030 [Streptomyces sp. Root63]|nr:hypothetical protein ASD97_40030 [Streptomyces sp. Root63]
MSRGRRLRRIIGVLSGLVAGEAGRTAGRYGGQRPGSVQLRAGAVRRALEDLGPLYIKVGQMLSTRPDMVSAAMVEELQKLHDRVEPKPFADFEPVLAAELGGGWAAGFLSFDAQHPIGTASLAQLYRAVLADGTPVAVKVQRQEVREVMDADMALLNTLARCAARRAPRLNAVIDFEAMLAVLFDAMRPELDFVLEAAINPQWAGGRPRLLSSDDEDFVIQTATTRPTVLGKPFTRWSVRKLADHLRREHSQARPDRPRGPAVLTGPLAAA